MFMVHICTIFALVVWKGLRGGGAGVTNERGVGTSQVLPLQKGGQVGESFSHAGGVSDTSFEVVLTWDT